MSDEQVSELRYIEELEAEVEKLREDLRNAYGSNQRIAKEATEARTEFYAERKLREKTEAEAEKLQRSTVHALYQGQMKRAEAAEAKLAEVETEILNEPLRAALDDYHGGPDWDEQDADRMGEAFITAFAVLRGEG